MRKALLLVILAAALMGFASCATTPAEPSEDVAVQQPGAMEADGSVAGATRAADLN